MMLYSVTPSFLMLSTILVGGLNLLAPFVSKKDTLLRSVALITITVCFFLNILIIDVLFIKGIMSNIQLLSFGCYSISLHIEPIGLIFLNTLGFLWIWSLIYTTSFIKINNIKNSSQFLFYINLSLLSGVIISLSANLFTMFIFYEILTITTLPLIAHSGRVKVQKDLYRYVKILMISSMMLFLPALLVIYAKCSHGDFIAEGFIKNHFGRTEAIILLLMFIFGISKAALYPLHGWLTSAMVATYPVSAILHAVVVVKTGVFCIFKILLYVFGLKYLQSIFIDFNWLIYFPIVTILYASVKALRTDNIKMILAYSTISQLSIALLSSFMFTPKAIAAGMLHLVSHSFGKICLFYACGNIYSIMHGTTIQDFSSISKKMPKTSLILLISSLSLIGLPPFGGFISKFYIMIESAKQCQILIMIVLSLSSIFSALYLGKIIVSIYNTSNSHYERMSSQTVIARSVATWQSPQANRHCERSEAISESIHYKPYEIATVATLLRNDVIDQQSEDRIPKSMFFSIIVCLSCSIFFFFIVRFINQFLSFLQ